MVVLHQPHRSAVRMLTITAIHPRVAVRANVINLAIPRNLVRTYASPAGLISPAKTAFRPPPAPISTSSPSSSSTVEDEHIPGEVEAADAPFDRYLELTAQKSYRKHATSVSELFSQYRGRAGRTINLVVPYEEKPAPHRRADRSPQTLSSGSEGQIGDGMVMIVYAVRGSNGRLGKICACSGFVVDARPIDGSNGDGNGDVVVTCAHTLEQMHRNLQKSSEDASPESFCFIISSTGEARLVGQVLSSMPRSDLITMQVDTANVTKSVKLKSLPVSPFPAHAGTAVSTHLFGASTPPIVTRSTSRLPKDTQELLETEIEKIEMPVSWLHGHAWRRWGSGIMLGYRSYTGIEVEAGIHSSLPHILTSILPTPGSSGGPLVCTQTGAVVGMISGRRMDNRVEGERGWGASAEGIFEMFSLPGFTPTGQVD